MNQKQFIRNISLLSLGFVISNPLLAALAVTHARRSFDIPFAKPQIRHGILNPWRIQLKHFPNWFQAFEIQHFLANGFERSKQDLSSFQFGVNDEPLSLHLIDSELRLAHQNGVIDLKTDGTSFIKKDYSIRFRSEGQLMMDHRNIVILIPMNSHFEEGSKWTICHSHKSGVLEIASDYSAVIVECGKNVIS